MTARRSTRSPIPTCPYLALLAAICLLALAAPAGAAVTEPNGVVVPTNDTGGGELRLDAFFAAEGESIAWQADAHAAPATFSPLCGFKATLKRMDSGSKFGVGWYNVDPNATAPPTQVFQIVPQGASPGSVFTGDDIRSSPSYAGGLIGFALIRSGSTPPYHYSEPQWNTYCSAGACAATPGNWVLSLVYKSVKLPNAWYMGFEDGATTSSGWSNDGDFNDSLFLFEGLACAGAGEPCEVQGQQGECANGLTECDAAGALVCKQVTLATGEACDGVDNDCDGEVDQGDALCPSDQLCHQGVCVPRCGSEEFACGAGEVCVSGLCVEEACASQSCDPGQACRGGVCVAPCDGVSCPGDQVCRLGRCVDPCDGVSCDGARVCVDGVCVEPCGCRGCDPGSACQEGAHPRSGRCVPEGCLDVACDPGTVCTDASAGRCIPLCEAGVSCPLGQICADGDCVADPSAGAEPDAAAPLVDFGGVDGAGAASSRDAGPPIDAGEDDRAGQGGAAKRSPSAQAPPLCACRLGRASGTREAWWGIALAVLLTARRRRRDGSCP